MSYDIQIWTTRPIEIPRALPDTGAWVCNGDSCTYEGRGWQLVVGHCQNVLPEDVPKEISGALPGIAHLMEINLEGAAPESALKRCRRVAMQLAKIGHGIAYDPQEDTVKLPSGVSRYAKPAKTETVDLLTFTWWFSDGIDQYFRTRDGVNQILICLERTLPESRPRRYGLWEPPQYNYAETGREHFFDLWYEHIGGVFIWYPHRPVATVFVHMPKSWGPSLGGFRGNTLEVQVEVSALSQPGWANALRLFWTSMSRLIRPFFGDVRTLRGYVLHGGRVGVARTTEVHPVKAWWWAGLPETGGHAVVIGEPYVGLWPEIAQAAQIIDGLAILDTGDWTTREDIFSRVPVPRGAVQRIPPREDPIPVEKVLAGKNKREYPELWPFGNPFADRL